MFDKKENYDLIWFSLILNLILKQEKKSYGDTTGSKCLLNQMGSNQSLASKDFPLYNFPILLFVPAGLAKILSRRWNDFTPPVAFWEVWSLFKNGDTTGHFTISAKGKNTSRSHSQVSFTNSTSLWKNCDHPVVMCHFAMRNWNTYTNQTTLLVC